MTINVWYLTAEELLNPSAQALKTQFQPLFRQLIDIIIHHLRYPSDFSNLSSQERDEFREFRHDIGDSLKDCVRVLGEETALEVPYKILLKCFEAFPQGQSFNFDSGVSWEEIEAPLFSLRTMCREVSSQESRYIPEIMGMLPQLPAHPKIKYAAILVIGRYAKWTNHHPDLLAYQLDFVTKGFNEDNDTSTAAAHTFRDLCRHCSKVFVAI